MVVVVRIRLAARVPRNLFREDNASVDNRAGLTIARAKVEADAAAVQIAAQRFRTFIGMRYGFRVRDFQGEGLLVDATHEFRVECALAAGAVDSPDSDSDVLRPAEGYSPSAALPEEKLDQPLDVRQVGRC